MGLTASVVQAGAVEYRFVPTYATTWDVTAKVAGDDTAGLSGYSIWVYGDATAIFAERHSGNKRRWLCSHRLLELF